MKPKTKTVLRETWDLALSIIDSHTKTQFFKYYTLNITNLDKLYELLTVREQFDLLTESDMDVCKLYVKGLDLTLSDGLSYTKVNSLKRLIEYYEDD